jgi:ParB family transcriptional regulator, chromosome partitioning protein
MVKNSTAYADSLAKRRDTERADPVPDPNKYLALLDIPANKIRRTFTFTYDRKPLRHFYDMEDIKQWADHDLKSNGIRAPLWVRPHPIYTDDYELVAGMRRHLAAEYLELETIPVRIFDWTNDQALDAAIAENANRQDFTPLEEADHIYSLLVGKLSKKNPDINEKEIGSILHRINNENLGNVKQKAECPYRDTVEEVFNTYGQISLGAFVRTRLKLNKMPNRILETIRRGELPFSTAVEIAKIKNEDEQANLLDHAINNSLSLADVKNYAKGSRSKKDKYNLHYVKRLIAIQETLGSSTISTDQDVRLGKILKQLERESNDWIKSTAQ